ncbi:hypothetical protein [Parabacteroides sp. Marseille-P3160]|mgnify:CR=1 FL=1|uniref:HYC_CC_PP family protein n=1 Tax=Parabacteroides sp. Marseille-P3160 TaxID=1917887 RepID=UPI0011194CE0|nr:hypothetical protein [Parabacteroides sp. Marseille-P3160]
MKRIISIFLLLVMLVVGLQPVLNMHFCGGDLLSVSIVERSDEGGCCCADKGHEPKAESNEASSLFLANEHRNCCVQQQIEIATDQYQVQSFELSKLLLSLNHIWLAWDYTINYINPGHSVSIQHLFPPGGLNKLNLDLLAFVCVYRI